MTTGSWAKRDAFRFFQPTTALAAEPSLKARWLAMILATLACCCEWELISEASAAPTFLDCLYDFTSWLTQSN
jgi:hypothetical protein